VTIEGLLKNILEELQVQTRLMTGDPEPVPATKKENVAPFPSGEKQAEKAQPLDPPATATAPATAIQIAQAKIAALEALTKNDVGQSLLVIAESEGGRDKVAAILKAFGATKLSELKPEDYAKVVKAAAEASA
jgi:hypothetical protein